MPGTSSIGELVIKFTADIAEILANTEKVQQQMSDFAASTTASLETLNSQFKALAGGITAAGEALAGLVSIHLAVDFVKGIVDANAELARLSEMTGFSVSMLSAFNNAIALSGDKVENAGMMLTRFERNLEQAANGAGRAVDALAKLGLSAKALLDLSPDQAFLKVTTAIVNLGHGYDQSTVAQDLFARGGAKLIPAMALLVEQGLSLATVTEQDAYTALAAEKQMAALKIVMDQLATVVLTAMLPPFIALARTLIQAGTTTGDFSGKVKSLAGDGSFAAWALNAAGSLAAFMDETVAVIYWVTALGRTFAAALVTLLDFGRAAAGLAEIGIGLSHLNFSQVKEGLAQVTGAYKDLDTVLPQLKSNFDTVMKGFQQGTAYTDAFAKNLKVVQAEITAAMNSAFASGGGIPKVQSDAFAKLLQAAQTYYKALAALEKAENDARTKVLEAELAVALKDLDKSYSEGLISTQEYWDRKNAIEKTQSEVSVEGLQKDLKTQQDLLDSLAASYGQISTALVGPKEAYKTLDDKVAALIKNLAEQATQQAKVATSAGALGVAMVKAKDVGTDWVTQLEKSNSVLSANAEALNKEAEAAAFATATMGDLPAQIALAKAAMVEANLAASILAGTIKEEDIPAAQALIAAYKNLAFELNQKTVQEDQIKAWDDVMKEAETVFTNILNSGKNTWQQLTQWLKDTLIKELFKLIATKWIIPLVVDLTGNAQLGTALGNQLGPSFLSSLFGGGGGASGLTGLAGLGEAAQNISTGFSTFTTLLDGGSTVLDALNISTIGLGASFAAFIPVVGVAIAAFTLLGGSNLFKSPPSQVEGTFGIRATGTSPGIFEDQAYINTKFGQLMIGFLDQGTQQFSGQAALVFDKVVGDSIDAFATRFSPAQSEQFATVLKNMTFQAFSGTFTTEDFLQKYGGQVLQQVVAAAFDILDPALGSVISNFKGTADEVAKFSNTLLSIYDATKNLGGGIKDTIDAALADATQATADKVLAFVQTLKAAITVFPALAAKFEQLSATDIPKFIDALGGAQAALDGINYLYANFTTAAQKTSDATAQLNTDFTNLGITSIPTTHAGFLALLASFDLTTDAGRQLYAAVLALAPLFVTVHGTADSAATSVTKAGDALAGLRTDAQTLALNTADLNSSFAALGESVPANHQAFLDLLGSIDQTTDKGKALYDALVALIPAFDAVNGSAQQAAAALATNQQFFDSHFFTAAEQATRNWATAQTDLTNALKDTNFTVPTTVEGFRSLLESIDRTTPAGEALYETLLKLGPEFYNAATAVDAATAAAAALASTAGGYVSQTAVQKFVANVQKQIDALNAQSVGDFGDKTGLKINLITDQIGQLQDALAAYSQTTGGIVDTTILTYQAEIRQLTNINNQLGDQLARFTVFKAQYGASIAEQLVNLQDWYTQQQGILSGNADALSALTSIFNAKWASIIAGTASGVTGTLNALDKLLQGIRDYITQLTQGPLSPLTPLQKLAQAQADYSSQLAKAQSGDQTALGNITKFADTFLKDARDVYASSSTYTDMFNNVVASLQGLTGSSPTDPLANLVKIATAVQVTTASAPTAAVSPVPIPAASETLLTNVLPTGSKIMSTADAATLGLKLDTVNKNLTTLFPALANANTADSKRSTSQLAQLLAQTNAALGFVPK